jgi:hypothetical protein
VRYYIGNNIPLVWLRKFAQSGFFKYDFGLLSANLQYKYKSESLDMKIIIPKEHEVGVQDDTGKPEMDADKENGAKDVGQQQIYI